MRNGIFNLFMLGHLAKSVFFSGSTAGAPPATVTSQLGQEPGILLHVNKPTMTDANASGHFRVLLYRLDGLCHRRLSRILAEI